MKQNRILFSFFLGFLILATLFSAVSCAGKPTNNGDPPGEVEAETKLTIGGKSIANHAIVFPEGQAALAQTVQAEIAAKANVTLPTTTSDPGDGKVICLRIDSGLQPRAYGFYTQGRTLTVFAKTAALLDEAVALFKTKLNELFQTAEGKKVDLASSFSANVIKTDGQAVSYETATGTKKVIGETTKNPISYAVGDTATLVVSAVAGDQLVSVPYFCIETWNEATGKGNTEYVDGSKGYIEYQIPMFVKPGFFYWMINACDKGKNKIAQFNDSADGYHFIGSAGFGVEQIQPAVAAPADFDSCWNEVLAKVRVQGTTGMKLDQINSSTYGFYTYYWEMPYGGKNSLGEANVAAGYLTVPISASEENKIGLKITFQAHDGDIPIPNPSYQDNTATLIVCAHGFDLEKAKKDIVYYGRQKTRIGNFSGNPDYFVEMIQRDLLGAKFLMEYFGESGNHFWDGETFVVAGNSMGAMQSTAVAALTKEVTGTDVSLLDIGIPWLCDVKGATAGRKVRTWPTKLEEMGRFDPVNFASRLTCKVKIYAALGDKYCPASGVMALYNGAKNVEKTITFQQNVSHGGGHGGGKYQLSQSLAQ